MFPIMTPQPAKMPGFCRDCLRDAPTEERRCRACGSPRLVRHAELLDLTIAHIDCDAFYAAVEKRDNPELADKPLIIGGGKRGVVSTACYLARIHGVRSAMPMFKALEACPDAVVVKPNMEKYACVGREVRQLMRELTPLVEPLSIDEAFMDLAGTERLHKGPPAVALARFAKRVEDEIGITASIGLSYCKFLAKVASDLEKPRGFSVIGAAEALAFLRDRPVGMIWGVGKAFAQKLQEDGIRQRFAAVSLGQEALELGKVARHDLHAELVLDAVDAGAEQRVCAERAMPCAELRPVRRIEGEAHADELLDLDVSLEQPRQEALQPRG